MPHLEAPIELEESWSDNSSGHFDNTEPPPAAIVQQAVTSAENSNIEYPTRDNRELLRNNSFDRDIDSREEDNYWPQQPYLLPVVLPAQSAEPTLDELLRRVIEGNDFNHVETLRLRVITYMISLSQLGLFLPRLQHLDLSGSVLSSLRDLGCSLIQLSHLDVSNCGLSSFDGTSGLPGLRTLVADRNMIQRIGPLSQLSLLQRLSIQHNRINELGLLTFLGMCPNLVELNLNGNPVCHLALYRTTLQRSIPSMQLLDGQSLTGTNSRNVEENSSLHNNSSTDGEVSSLSSEIYSHSSLESTDFKTKSILRPATAPLNMANGESNCVQPRRAASVSGYAGYIRHSLAATVSVGSLARIIRRPRDSWTSSSSIESSLSSFSAPSNTKHFSKNPKSNAFK